ncbi:MAG: hypothetical protein HOY79_17480 [Streptomyces sp.]|nr:hypothetical protein [Streptomyces sp.]
MTATKLLPPHGTYARYSGDKRRNIPPCRCQPCRAGYNRYRKHRELYSPYSFDAAPVAEHIRMLLAADDTATVASIARASHVHESILHKILSGKRRTVFADTRTRVLAIRHAPDENARTDATDSIRRLRALIAAGHSTRALREAGRVNKQTLSALITGAQPTVTIRTARSIAELYDRISMTVGDSVLSRNRAARNGWAPPLAWINIDDPDEDPAGWERSAGRRPAEDLVAEAEEIRRTCGIDWDLVAERLEVSRNALDKARERVAARAKQKQVAA